MYNETLSNRDGPWFGTGDVATRTSNVGYDEVVSVPSLPASRTYVSSGTGTGTATSTSRSGAGQKTAGNAAGFAAFVVALSAGVLAVVA